MAGRRGRPVQDHLDDPLREHGDRKASSDYWAATHGPISRRAQGFTRNVRTHVMAVPGGNLNFDGFSEHRLPSRETYAAMLASTPSTVPSAAAATAGTGVRTRVLASVDEAPLGRNALLDCIHLVFSKVPEGVGVEAFELWHGAHARTALTDPAVQALRLFRMAPDVGGIPPIGYTHMALYQCSGALGAVAAGDLLTPDWSGKVRIASFYGFPLETRIDLARLDHVYLVFTRPPASVSVPDFFEWYATHMRENLTAEGFDAAWRYRLDLDMVDPLEPSDAVHAALYEVHGELPELRASLDRAEDDGRVIFPEWFPGMALACLDCYAISDVLAAAGDPVAQR